MPNIDEIVNQLTAEEKVALANKLAEQPKNDEKGEKNAEETVKPNEEVAKTNENAENTAKNTEETAKTEEQAQTNEEQGNNPENENNTPATVKEESNKAVGIRVGDLMTREEFEEKAGALLARLEALEKSNQTLTEENAELRKYKGDFGNAQKQGIDARNTDADDDFESYSAKYK